jgi:hypothetical protein
LVNAGVVSKSRFPARDTIKATKPQANAAATADPNATRRAIFEKGSSVAKTQE